MSILWQRPSSAVELALSATYCCNWKRLLNPKFTKGIHLGITSGIHIIPGIIGIGVVTALMITMSISQAMKTLPPIGYYDGSSLYRYLPRWFNPDTTPRTVYGILWDGGAAVWT